MPERKPKRPRDINELGVTIAKLATGETSEPDPEPDARNPAAVALGRKGGKAGAAKLTPEERKARAQRAVGARWARRSDDP